MRRSSMIALAITFALSCGALLAAPPANAGWPSVDQQIRKDHVRSGSALERVIRENQDFQMLRAEEASDTLPVPAWLRVYWRKAHPEGNYSADDPTGGYPLVLKEIHEWMLTHQDLRAGDPDNLHLASILEGESEGKALAVTTESLTVGTDLRISEATTNPRSESAISINPLNVNKIIGSSNNIGGNGRQAMYYSSNGGLTWATSFLPLTNRDQFHSDPTIDWTSDGTAWSATLGIRGFTLQARAFKSTDGGATWTVDATYSGSQKNVDKEMLWIDHSATSPFRDYIYSCWHNGNPQYVNRRTGIAGAWGTPIQISGTESTGTSIGCDVRTNANGDAFVFWPTTGNRRIIMAKSTNGGASWATPKVVYTTFDSYDIGVPSFNSRRILIYTSGGAYRTATKNNVYVTFTDLSGATGCTTAANEPGSNAASACKTRIWFARSTDGGTTWSAPVKINDQASNNDQFNQWLAVDEATGAIGVMYYDTVADATRKKSKVYFQLSVDDGVTWSPAAVASSQFTDETISGADSGNQYGDYNGLAGVAGTFFPSWTDRRNAAKEEVWSSPIITP